jgi:hypothetical protein
MAQSNPSLFQYFSQAQRGRGLLENVFGPDFMQKQSYFTVDSATGIWYGATASVGVYEPTVVPGDLVRSRKRDRSQPWTSQILRMSTPCQESLVLPLVQL